MLFLHRNGLSPSIPCRSPGALSSYHDVATPSPIAPELTTLIAKSPSWSEDFSAPPSPQYWDRGFSAWPNTVNNRILWASGEVEVYIDKTNFGHDELSWRQGHVIFTAERMNSAERADIDTRILREHINGKAANALRRARWVSSLPKDDAPFSTAILRHDCAGMEVKAHGLPSGFYRNMPHGRRKSTYLKFPATRRRIRHCIPCQATQRPI